MTDAQLALVSALSAAALTAGVSYVVVKTQMRHESKERKLDRASQREEARLADERHLRDAKAERLRQDYEAVAFAATEIQGATAQLAMLWQGDTEEARDARVNERLDVATKDLGRAMIRLHFEGAQALVDTYQEIQAAWYEYKDLRAASWRPAQRVGETLTRLSAGVSIILTKAKADLDALSKPI